METRAVERGQEGGSRAGDDESRVGGVCFRAGRRGRADPVSSSVISFSVLAGQVHQALYDSVHLESQP